MLNGTASDTETLWLWPLPIFRFRFPPSTWCKSRNFKKSRLPRRPKRPNTSGGAARAQQPLGHVRHVTFHAAASADVTCRAGSGRGNFIFQKRAVQFSRRAESESGDRFSYSTKVKKFGLREADERHPELPRRHLPSALDLTHAYSKVSRLLCK